MFTLGSCLLNPYFKSSDFKRPLFACIRITQTGVLKYPIYHCRYLCRILLILSFVYWKIELVDILIHCVIAQSCLPLQPLLSPLRLPSMGFFQEEYRNGLPFPFSRTFSTQGPNRIWVSWAASRFFPLLSHQGSLSEMDVIVVSASDLLSGNRPAFILKVLFALRSSLGLI